MSAKTMESLLLVPPNLQRAVHFLVIRLYQAEHLPSMDSSTLGLKKVQLPCTGVLWHSRMPPSLTSSLLLCAQNGIDAYIQVDFAGPRPSVTVRHLPPFAHTPLVVCALSQPGSQVSCT